MKDDKNCVNEAKLFRDAMCDGIRGNLRKNNNYFEYPQTTGMI